MWIPHRPQATAAESALLRLLAVPAILLVLGALAWNSCATWNLERHAQRDAQAACVASGLSEPECRLQVKQRGELCWDRHYFRGRKGLPSGLNEAGYRACILDTEAAAPTPLR